MRSLFALVAVCAFAIPAVAQESMGNRTPLGGEVKPGRALRITLSGEFGFALVARDDDAFRAALGNATTGAAGANLIPSTSTDTGGDVFFDPNISITMDFEMASAVHAIVQLSTQHHEFVSGTRAGGVFSQDRDLEVEQAFVRWNRAFDQDLTVQVGIQNFRKDFAGTGNPFLVDVHHSESPFNNPTANTTPGADTDLGTPQSASSGSVHRQEAAGVYGRYGIGDAHLDLFFFTIAETFRANSDDQLWGASFEHRVTGDHETQVGVIAMVLNNDSTSYLGTFGGGGYTFLGNKALKLYGEGYVQVGQYGTAAVAGQAARRKIKQQESYAVFGGLRYYLPGLEDFDAYIDGSYWEVSGDDDGADFVNSSFVSLENNNDLLVVEDGYYGLDIDTNYRAVKIKAGFIPVSSVTIEGTYAFIELQDNNGTADNSVSSHDRIGNEIDLELTYRATDKLVFKARTGWLFDPKVLGVNDEINVTVVEAKLEF